MTYNAQAVLRSYVDDAFGDDLSYSTAKDLIQYIISAGKELGTLVNTDKKEGPKISMVILGLLNSSDRIVCSLDPVKVLKYSEQIETLLKQR